MIVEARLGGRLGRYAETELRRAGSTLRSAADRLRLPAGCEVSLMLCDAPAIRRLNRRWRGKDKPTDVLSFPAQELSPGVRPAPCHLGDIALAPAVARRGAAEWGVPFPRHMDHLLVHGLLHLLGYDHGTRAEAAVMESLEAGLLKEMGSRHDG